MKNDSFVAAKKRGHRKPEKDPFIPRTLFVVLDCYGAPRSAHHSYEEARESTFYSTDRMVRYRVAPPNKWAAVLGQLCGFGFFVLLILALAKGFHWLLT